MDERRNEYNDLHNDIPESERLYSEIGAKLSRPHISPVLAPRMLILDSIHAAEHSSAATPSGSVFHVHTAHTASLLSTAIVTVQIVDSHRSVSRHFIAKVKVGQMIKPCFIERLTFCCRKLINYKISID